MRYLCVHCDHRWEAEGSDAPKRCPSCMRATGVESEGALASRARAGASRRNLWLLAAALVAVASAGVVLLVPRDAEAPAKGALSPLATDDLAELLAQEQVTADGLERLLAADDAMTRFAQRVAGKQDGSFARAEAVTQAMRARASATAFVPWSLGEPRGTPVMVAKNVLPLVQKDNGRAQLYPLELAVLEAALLRSLDVPAMVAELADLPGERAPLDPSGYLGYFVVAVYENEAGQSAPRLYDPYGGRKLAGSEKHTVLSDEAVVGAALGMRAVFEMAYKADPRAALESSSRALHVAASLPSVRTARAIVVLGARMVEQGLAELDAARQLRADAARLHNLASALMLAGDLEGADKQLTSALSMAPDYAGARASLAGLDMMRGDTDGARAELATAERLAPDLSLVQWGLAEQLIRSGSRDGGLDRARRAAQSRPTFDARLRLAAVLRQASHYEEMRKVAHELVALAPEYRRGEVRELVLAVLGPTALDSVELDESTEDLATVGGPSLDLKLQQGSSLLGDAPSGGDLTLGKKAGEGEHLILLRDPSKLRLRGSGKELKLDLKSE